MHRRSCLALLGALAVTIAGPARAADAPLLSVAHAIEIDARPDQVWDFVGDFVGLPRWAVGFESSRLVLGSNNVVGAIRELRRGNGTIVREQLVEWDPWNRTITYRYADGMVISSDYYATMTVSELPGGRSRVDWKATFRRLAYWTDNPPPGMDDATPLKALNRVYPIGLANLKKVVEEAAR